MEKKTKIIKTIAIISTVLVVAGCSTAPNQEKLEQKGMEAFEAGNRQEGIEYLIQAEEAGDLSEESKNKLFEYYCEEAKAASESTDYELATSNYEKAGSYGSFSEEEKGSISELYVLYANSVEDNTEKTELLEKALEYDPKNSKAANDFIRVCNKKSSADYEKALLAIDKYEFSWNKILFENIRKSYAEAMNIAIQNRDQESAMKYMEILVGYIAKDPQFNWENYYEVTDTELSPEDMGEFGLPVFPDLSGEDVEKAAKEVAIYYCKLDALYEVLDDYGVDFKLSETTKSLYNMFEQNRGMDEYFNSRTDIKTELKDLEVGDIVKYGTHLNSEHLKDVDSWDSDAVPALFMVVEVEGDEVTLISLCDEWVLGVRVEIDLTEKENDYYSDRGNSGNLLEKEISDVNKQYVLPSEGTVAFPTKENYQEYKDIISENATFADLHGYFSAIAELVYENYNVWSAGFYDCYSEYSDDEVWFIPDGEPKYNVTETTKTVDVRTGYNPKFGYEEWTKESHQFRIYQLEGCYLDKKAESLNIHSLLQLPVE